jgi:dTDP-4-dehydrorhamnose 3,5-epimerase
VPQSTESRVIQGVTTVDLVVHADPRGRFAETFRKEWFPQRSWERIQCNRSESRAGVLRGLHYHHRQVDYWHCVAGRIRVGLYDLRRSSPTRGRAQVLELGQEQPQGLFIPTGVAHGFVALSDAVLIYVVDNYYHNTDELGVAWDDHNLGLDWGLEAAPVLSDRDAANPRLADIPAQALPS